MSSRVNLSLLVEYINSLSNDELDPNLKFKILYGGSTCAAPAKINEHVPGSFFSFDVTAKMLSSFPEINVGLGRDVLRDEIESKFDAKLPIFADILNLFGSTVELTEPLLYSILPFLWGEVSSKILKETVTKVGKLLNNNPGRNGNVKGKSVLQLEVELEKMKGEIGKMKEENEKMKGENEEMKGECERLQRQVEDLQEMMMEESNAREQKRSRRR